MQAVSTGAEFRAVEFLVSETNVEIGLARLCIGANGVQKVFRDIKLGTTIGNKDSLEQLSARLYFMRRWVVDTPVVD
ncbi:hypothetical protein BGZ59_006646 [Podila verticillata]|nr:hypothetical protein BGZ59_006646 [Podila verticillata]